jgi:CysZ protein
VVLLFRGLSICLRSPRLYALGLLPALIAGLLYAAALTLLILFLNDLSSAVTWFADDWSRAWRDAIRVFAGLGVLGVAGLISVLTFTAVTLLIGDPFYEKISERVEHRFGGVPGAVLFVGLIPVAGQILGAVLGGAIGGWVLALELTGVPFQRRGLRLRDRRAVLGRNRAMTLGFGAAVFASFLIPLGAVLLMPAAVAGAALLARRSLGQPIDIVTVTAEL